MGVVHRWEEYYAGEVQAVLEGTWKNDSVWGGAERHMIELADIAADAPKSVVDDIRAVYAKMENKQFSPFVGPIVSNEGKVMIPEGKSPRTTTCAT